ncbi:MULTISPECIES: ParB/RepB/Spo0J family partition protein [Nostoc]|uniref:ParB/RepB/Spo0J family partition protein n=1 Tax=Nostoc paludosum FACHB-159 TaxID=2692908 RepID=A0ABR8KNA0_9NOSO|nr:MULTISPECIES: ParB/RepB/Spo0J family partition protein [Nostoc]MBD2683047.1 ParB/RepB/Spo0J family partition protein [Nostoc sp. FACHB-857]MBD2739388.1 ParB/RepB/Spo0J family partition protein [Nostoc paludosum FACHB-159]
MRRTKATQPLKSKIEVPWDTTGVANAGSPQSMPLDQIVLPPTQPRRYFEESALKQLTESIKQHGILQPLLVRPVADGKHELVAGERRYRAAQELALTEVPVVIKELDDNAAFQLALVENLLREDLNPVEETEGILQLLALKLGRSIQEVPPLLYRLQRLENKASTLTHNVMGAPDGEGDEPTHNVMGETETPNLNLNDEPLADPDLKIVEGVFEGLGLMTWASFVKNRLPLLNLPEDILDALRDGSIEYTKAKAIAQISQLNERVEFLEQAIAQNWSLSEIKQRISEKKTRASNSQTESNNYKERFTVATTKLKKSRIWSDPKKRKQIEKLLSQIEALTSVE